MTAQHPAGKSLTIRLFGTFDVRINGSTLPRLRSAKGRFLLTLLLLRQPMPVERSRLAGLLWPESDESQALANLRLSLTDLRKALGSEAGRLSAPTPHTLRFDISGAWLDTAEFDDAITRGDEDSQEAAVALYRGALADGCAEEWALPERDAREEAFLRALESLASQAIGAGDAPRAVTYLRRVVATDPLRESAQRELMRALAATGARGAAVQAYRDLRTMLRRDLNSTPDSETIALFEHIRARSEIPSATRQQPAIDSVCPRRLPRPLTSLIGREQEAEEVRALLSSASLLTLTGPGGVGKTRLAVQAAEIATEYFPDSAWFVDLAPITDPSLVEQTVAAALSIRNEPGSPLSVTLVERLTNRSMLLVLDNCEHVVSACAALVAAFLSGCAKVKILATSRQPLAVSGELVWPVPALSVPTRAEIKSTGKGDAAGLLEHDGVRLFVDRAWLAQPGHRFTSDDIRVVAEVCRDLEGNALAIELAAARTNVLTTRQIAARLSERFRLLTGGRSSAPRQQTLRATLDWSYDLLTVPERSALCRFSVFAGGWTLEAAEALCMDEQTDRFDVLDLLASLIAKSLVGQEETDGQRRYRLLVSVRQYASERLAECGETDRLRSAHATYFATMAKEGEHRFRTSEQLAWLAILDSEHDNMRAALAWSMETDEHGRTGVAMQIVDGLSRFWLRRGYLREAQEWLGSALARVARGEPTRAYARALNGAGLIAYRLSEHAKAIEHHGLAYAIGCDLGDESAILYALCGLASAANSLGEYASAERYRSEALPLSRKLREPFAEASLLLNWGTIAKNRGEYEESRDLLGQALAVARTIGARTLEGAILHNLANAVKDSGDAAGSRVHYEESLAIHREIGDRYYQAINLFELSEVSERGGDLTAWRSYVEESLALSRELGIPFIEAACVHHIGDRALEEGDVRSALPMHRDSLLLFVRTKSKIEIAYSLSAFGWICALKGADEAAVRLWGAQAALRESIGAPAIPFEVERYQRLEAAARLQIGPVAYEAARAEGHAMSMNEAIQYALAVTL